MFSRLGNPIIIVKKEGTTRLINEITTYRREWNGRSFTTFILFSLSFGLLYIREKGRPDIGLKSADVEKRRVINQSKIDYRFEAFSRADSIEQSWFFGFRACHATPATNRIHIHARVELEKL